jgi:DNA repair protein RadB
MVETKISAGSYDLNKFLFGGYEKDIITTIYGPGGSGKTNLCMLVAVSQAKKGNKVIYMDTEGGFSTERAMQISGEKDSSFLKNIFILRPTSFKEQEKEFESLLKHVNQGDISLIIIDSIAMLYRLELAEAIQSKEDAKIKQVNSNLAMQLRKLNEIATRQKIPIVVTNQVYSLFVKNSDLKEEKQVSMVGGDLLKYWSKCLMELKRTNNKRILELKKHRSLPEKSLDFEITNAGIRKKGWI